MKAATQGRHEQSLAADGHVAGHDLGQDLLEIGLSAHVGQVRAEADDPQHGDRRDQQERGGPSETMAITRFSRAASRGLRVERTCWMA